MSMPWIAAPLLRAATLAPAQQSPPTLEGQALVNPITGTNWAGTGVEPELPVEAARALQVAQHERQQAIEERRKQVPSR
jgi:hypothetical protein